MEGPPPLPHIVRWAIDICKGMEYLHQLGLLHRDIKSTNILVDASGAARVGDLGLSRTGVSSLSGNMTMLAGYVIFNC